MSSSLNRTVILMLVNKSGFAVSQGTVVIVDTANADSFITSGTPEYYSGTVGVVADPYGIGNGARGAVAIAGYVPKMYSTNSAAYGDKLFVSSSPGSASARNTKGVGDFGQALSAGTTVEAVLWGSPEPGSPCPVLPPYAQIADVKPTGNGGGDPPWSPGWTRRDLNTVVVNEDNIYINLHDGNLFDLNKGKYIFRAHAPAFMCGNHRLMLYDASNNANMFFGTSEFSFSDGATYSAPQTRSYVQGQFTVSSDGTSYTVQHYTQSGFTGGLGKPTNDGENEVYTVVELWKVY